MRRRFFVDRFDSDIASLRGDAAEHLGRVLRAEPGQLYELSDGQSVWLGRVERVEVSRRGPGRIDFSLVEPIPQRADSLRIQLFISLVKFDRFEWCLEKATELGVAEVIPLAAARTDKPLIAAAEKRQERWRRILLESAQQARRLQVPFLSDAISADKAFAGCASECKILLSERREAPTMRAVLDGYADAKAAALAVGPEGGWTDGEIAAARAVSFAEASLGENILRAETAVIASLAVLRFALEK